MNNTALNNGIDLTVPTFNDGSTPQPNGQQNNQPQQNDTTKIKGAIKENLDDIMPDPKAPRAMRRAPKDNNLAQPLPRNNSEETIQSQQPQQEQPQPQQAQPQQPESQQDQPEQNEKETQQSPEQVVSPQEETTQQPPEPQMEQTPETPPAQQQESSNSSPADGGVIPERPIQKEEEKKIESLLEYTIEKGASDLHITVGYPPIIRVDGTLEKVNDNIVDPAEAEELILPLLSDEKRELLEVNKEIDLAYTHEGKYIGRFRINAFYSMKTLSASFRLIPGRIRTIEELKLPNIYHQFTPLKQGMILVTGPTGHGKSTTIAAMLEDINRTRFERVVTIEDPIEYIFDGKKALFDQREMGQDTHSWTIALKSAMRQDPDVILVGEMRDYETIAAAITLAETGHLVFATLHTNNTAQSIDRMIDVFPEEQQSQIRAQLSNILEVVIAQRLVPLKQGGRRAVAEILVVNPAVKTLIREGKTHQVDNVIRTSSDIGMVSLERSLVQLVREGVIGVEKAQEYSVYPEEVTRLLKS